MKRHYPLVVFGVLHTIVFLLFYVFAINGRELSSDIQYYFRLANFMVTGQLPYVDFGIEYPPLALPVLVVPRLLASSPTAYSAMFAAEMLVFHLAMLGFSAALLRKLRYNVWIGLGMVTIALLAIGPIVLDRFDMAPAAITAAALYFFTARRYGLAWFFVAIGAMTKLYPAALGPVFLLAQVKERQWRSLWSGLGIGAITVGLIAAPCLKLGPSGFISTFTFHMERSLQIESLYSSVLLLAHNLRLTSVQVITAAGSVNIGSPLADNIASLSPVFIIAALLAVYGIYWRKLARRPESASVINFSLAAILGFIVTSKILSPQYVIWVLPFLPLLAGRWRGAWWALFLLIGSLTYYIFPAHYEEYLNGRMLEVVILLCRNLLLVVFMLWLLFEGRHKTATPHLPDQTPSQ